MTIWKNKGKKELGAYFPCMGSWVQNRKGQRQIQQTKKIKNIKNKNSAEENLEA